MASRWKNKIAVTSEIAPDPTWEEIWFNEGLDVGLCPHCKNGNLLYAGQLKPTKGPPVYPEVKSKPNNNIVQLYALS